MSDYNYKEIYRDLSDQKIIQLAYFDSDNINEEAFPILLNELEVRNINPEIINIAKSKRLTPTSSEVDMIMDVFQEFPCPKCGKSHIPKNSIYISQTFGFLLFSKSTRKEMIACEECLRKELSTSNFNILVFGWFSFSGIFKVVKYYKSNKKSLAVLEKKIPTEAMRDFVKSNMAVIAMCQQNPTYLTLELKMYNNLNEFSKNPIIIPW